jgi:hypothetical protein
MNVHRPDRAGRRVVTPQRDGQALGADRLVRVQQEDREDRARLGPAHHDDACVPAHLERSQNRELHRHPPRR